MSPAHPKCRAAPLRPSACGGGSLAGWPGWPLCLNGNVDAPPCPQTLAAPQGEQSPPCCPPSTDGLTASVHRLHSYCLVSFPKQVTQQSAPARAHTCTLSPRKRAWAVGSAAVCPLLKPRHQQLHPSASNPLCPQSVECPPGTSRPFSALPFRVFQEDEEENTSVNSMFLGCLIKRDKIAEELRAGLAGVGSHALLPRAAASG